MRMIVVAGFLTLALFVAVLGAVGAHPSSWGPSDDFVSAARTVTQSVPAEQTSNRWRG